MEIPKFPFPFLGHSAEHDPPSDSHDYALFSPQQTAPSDSPEFALVQPEHPLEIKINNANVDIAEERFTQQDEAAFYALYLMQRTAGREITLPDTDLPFASEPEFIPGHESASNLTRTEEIQGTAGNIITIGDETEQQHAHWIDTLSQIAKEAAK